MTVLGLNLIFGLHLCDLTHSNILSQTEMHVLKMWLKTWNTAHLFRISRHDMFDFKVTFFHFVEIISPVDSDIYDTFSSNKPSKHDILCQKQSLFSSAKYSWCKEFDLWNTKQVFHEMSSVLRVRSVWKWGL